MIRLQISERGLHMDQPKYLHTDIYEDMLDRLMTARPTFNQPCLRSAIIEILGEIGNIWPYSIANGNAKPRYRVKAVSCPVAAGAAQKEAA
jgi:hypothetical protein